MATFKTIVFLWYMATFKTVEFLWYMATFKTIVFLWYTATFKTIVFLWYMVTFRNDWWYQRGDEIEVVNQRRKDNTMAKKEQRDTQRSIKHYTSN
jgi:hypothetical protein